jgi:hypothetical protein
MNMAGVTLCRFFLLQRVNFRTFIKKKVASRLCPSYRCKKEGETTLIFGGGDLVKSPYGVQKSA